MLPTLVNLKRHARTPSSVGLLDRDFDQLIRRWWEDAGDDLVGSYPVDIREEQEHIYVDAELPGFTKDQVQVTLEQGQLTITAQRDGDQSKGEKHLSERRFTRVARSFTLPNTVDETKVDATLDKGVLHLVLSKHDQVKPRRISIR